METETTTEVTKDPRVELMELKLAVRMFCYQMEVCAAIPGVSQDVLKIQMNSDDYKKMKSKISTEQPVPTREEVESTETSNI